MLGVLLLMYARPYIPAIPGAPKLDMSIFGLELIHPPSPFFVGRHPSPDPSFERIVELIHVLRDCSTPEGDNKKSRWGWARPFIYNCFILLLMDICFRMWLLSSRVDRLMTSLVGRLMISLVGRLMVSLVGRLTVSLVGRLRPPRSLKLPNCGMHPAPIASLVIE